MPDPSLYLSEAEVARKVLPAGQRDRWSGIATVLEREGFPRIDTLMGGRYWPAVQAWLDARHGLAANPPAQPDGTETWEPQIPPRRRPALNGASVATASSRSGRQAAN